MPEFTPTRRGICGLIAIVPLAGCSGLFGPEFPENSQHPPDEYVETVETFVERVHVGEYEEARTPFDQELSDALPAEEIQSVWADEVGHLGEYRGVQEWAYEPDEPDEERLEVVYAQVSMEEGSYDLRTAMDGEGRMAGVYIIEVDSE